MKHLLLISLAMLAGHIARLNAQWINVTPPVAIDVRFLEAVDHQTAYVLSSDNFNALHRTTDKGQNWMTSNLPEWNSPDMMYWDGLFFTDANHGFVYGTWLVDGGVFQGGTESFTLFSTQDGGQTWLDRTPQVPTDGFQSLNSIHFFNPQQGFVTYSTGFGYSLVMTTDNGGASWAVQDTLYNLDRTMHLKPDGTGIVLRYQHQSPEPVYFVYQIADFGKTWTLIGAPDNDPDWAEHRIGLFYDNQYYLNHDVVFRWRQDLQAPGTSDDILYIDVSKNGGQTWQEDFFSITGEYVNRFEAFTDGIWLQTWKDVLRRDFTTINTAQPELTDHSTIKAVPNPAKAGSTLYLEAPDDLGTDAQARLLTADGRLVRDLTLFFQAGKSHWLTPGDLLPGVYFLQLSFKGKSETVRFIVRE